MRFNDDEEVMLTCERERGQTRVRAVGNDISGDGLVAEGSGDSLEEALVDLINRLAEMHEVF